MPLYKAAEKAMCFYHLRADHMRCFFLLAVDFYFVFYSVIGWEVTKHI